MAIHYVLPEVSRLQAQIKDLEDQIYALNDQNRQLLRQQPTRFHSMGLPPELRNLIWEQALPDRRVLRIVDYSTDMYNTHPFFCFARAPVLLHVCRESRGVALAHFKPLFETEVSRPVYFRPKFDILHLSPNAIADFAEEYPDIGEVESIAIPRDDMKYYWHELTNSGHFKSMTRLLLVGSSKLGSQTHRCCAIINLSPDRASQQQESFLWEEFIDCKRAEADWPPDLRHVEAVVATIVRHDCYLT
ncbi:hypothetical protein PG997_005499 [Apiospora hydei]|uniref:2EXR domain-containing protein n=1 Tax=Apiospora hydei TaxID=1337664 RepID=A0ABR1WQE0_9PEZI